MFNTMKQNWRRTALLGGMIALSTMTGGCASIIAAAAVGAGTEIVRQTQGILTDSAEAGGHILVHEAAEAGRAAAHGNTPNDGTASDTLATSNPIPGEAAAMLSESIDRETLSTSIATTATGEDSHPLEATASVDTHHQYSMTDTAIAQDAVAAPTREPANALAPISDARLDPFDAANAVP